MKSKNRGTNMKKQREAAKKEALRVKDAAFFAAVKYTLLGFGLMFLSCILYYIGYEYSPGAFLLPKRETPVSVPLCITLWLSARCIKKARENIPAGRVLFRFHYMAWYIAMTFLAVLSSLMWVLDTFLALCE